MGNMPLTIINLCFLLMWMLITFLGKFYLAMKEADDGQPRLNWDGIYAAHNLSFLFIWVLKRVSLENAVLHFLQRLDLDMKRANNSWPAGMEKNRQFWQLISNWYQIFANISTDIRCFQAKSNIMKKISADMIRSETNWKRSLQVMASTLCTSLTLH